MADKEEGEGSGITRPAENDRSPENLEDNLSFLDKLKCMMYSKVERDAFLIEKLEKEEKKKAKAAKKSGESSGATSQANKKDKHSGGGFFGKMKTTFSSPTEQTQLLPQGATASGGEKDEHPEVSSGDDDKSSLSPSGDLAKP